MWIVLAFGSALFAGLTAILAKIGVQDMDSTLATALRTVVVLVFSWGMVFLAGSQHTLPALSGHSLLFLVLSGLATGASWLCYFRALQVGDVNKVVPVDKTSTVLTMLLAALLLGEPFSVLKGVCAALILAGTWLMIEKKAGAAPAPKGEGWLLFAVLAAVFASLTAVLAKIGIQDVEANLGTALRTGVVLAMAWGIVFATGKQRQVRGISRRSWLFLLLSGCATGFSWLCYFRALQLGPASVVVPIDKLSILVTAVFARVALKEKLSGKSGAGLALITAGTLLLLLDI